jgi:hypothetical protein
VKFGGGIFAGTAIVLLDALYLLATGVSKAQLHAWIRSLLLVAAAFFVVELIWVTLACRTGPPGLAVDSIFPLYMFRAYSVVSGDIRWPMWNGWRMAVGQHLLPVSAGVLGLVGLVGWLRGLREDTDAEQERAGAVGGIFVALVLHHLDVHVHTLVRSGGIRPITG